MSSFFACNTRGSETRSSAINGFIGIINIYFIAGKVPFIYYFELNMEAFCSEEGLMMRISKNVLNYSITTKILFLTGITTIVCIAFIIGFIGVNTYATLIGVYERNLHLDAEYYTQSIESSVNTVSDKLKTLALVHEVNDIDYENKKFTAIAENLLSGNSQFI